MSVTRAFDRAQDAYKLAKKPSVQQKIVLFVNPGRVREGIIKAETRFPYFGKIVDVYASCATEGTSKTEIQVEKCTQEDYDTAPVWSGIFSTNLSIEPLAKSSRSADVPYSLASDIISENDHLRVRVVHAGDGMEGLTVEIVVQV